MISKKEMQEIYKKIERLANLKPADKFEDYLSDCKTIEDLRNDLEYSLEMMPNNIEEQKKTYNNLSNLLELCLKEYAGNSLG